MLWGPMPRDMMRAVMTRPPQPPFPRPGQDRTSVATGKWCVLRCVLYLRCVRLAVCAVSGGPSCVLSCLPQVLCAAGGKRVCLLRPQLLPLTLSVGLPLARAETVATASCHAAGTDVGQRRCCVQAASRGMQPWGQLDKILLAAGPGGGGNGQAYGMPGRASMPLSAHELQSYSRPQGSLPLNLMPPLNGVMGAKNGVGVGKQGQHEQLQQSGGAHMSLPSSSGDMQHDNRSPSSTPVVCLPSPHARCPPASLPLAACSCGACVV